MPPWRQQDADTNERLGFLVHELRNSLGTAMLAVAAMEAGTLSIKGATGAVLNRSLAALKTLLDRAIDDVRKRSASHNESHVFYVASLISDVQSSASLYADASGCTFTVPAVDPLMAVFANRERVMGAVTNLLQNAFKFTLPHTEITLRASSFGHDVLIDVSDHCGGLPHGSAETMFSPFKQRSTDRTGLGLGLSIARQSIERDGGTLTVADVPGTGCVFTIRMPRHMLV